MIAIFLGVFKLNEFIRLFDTRTRVKVIFNNCSRVIKLKHMRQSFSPTIYLSILN